MRARWLAVTLLTGLVAWACGGDDDAGAPPPVDAGTDTKTPPSPDDAGTFEAAAPLGHTAGKCGATERAIGFGSASTSGILSGEDEAVSSLAIDGQGNLFVAGWTREAVDGGTKNKSLLLEKRDANRTVLWRNVAGDDTQGLFQAAFTRVHGMTLDGSGGVVVAGIFAGTLALGGAPLLSAKQKPDAGPDASVPDGGFDFPPCSMGVGDCFGDGFVARFDPATGTHSWSVRFGGADGDGANAVARAPDGSIFVGGFFTIDADFGATKLTSAGKTDAFVVHLAADTGAILGAFRLGGAGNDAITGIAFDPSGDLIVTGYYSGSISIGATTHAVKHDKIDGFVAKLSPSGEARWSKSTTSGRAAELFSVTTDTSGNAYVAGTIDGTFEFGTIAGKSYYAEDAFVAKLDPNGALLWSKLWGGDGEEVAQSIALGPGGSIFVSGTASAPRGVDFGGGPIGGGAGSSGPFFVELTNAGDHVCSRSYPGGNGADIDAGPDAGFVVVGAGSNAIVAATPTSFAAGGTFAATLDLGKGPMTSHGGYDLWIAEFAR